MQFREFNLSQAIELIKNYEGCKLTSYQCPAGVWTIGYGTTKNVSENMTINKEDAERLLYNEVVAVAEKLYKYKDNFNNNSFNAYVSFFYNLGFKNDMFIRIQKGVPISECNRYIKLYTMANGKELKGLINRRSEEFALAER